MAPESQPSTAAHHRQTRPEQSRDMKGQVNAVTSPEDTPQAPSRRRNRGRNLVTGSPHREEFERLLQSGWSSIALERYAAYRYGEQISAPTFRRHRVKKGIVPKPSPFMETHSDEAVDPISKRAALIHLQEERIRIDVEHERNMAKLFTTTRMEIALLGQLITEHKTDLQDLGLLPRAGEKIEVTTPGPKPWEVPTAQTLGDLFEVSEDESIDLAKVLHFGLNQAVGAERPREAFSGPQDPSPTLHPNPGRESPTEGSSGLTRAAPPPSPPRLGMQGGQNRQGPTFRS